MPKVNIFRLLEYRGMEIFDFVANTQLVYIINYTKKTQLVYKINNTKNFNKQRTEQENSVTFTIRNFSNE